VRGDFLLIGKVAAILMGYPEMTQEVDRPIQSSANRHPASLTQTAIYSQTAKLAVIEAKRPARPASKQACGFDDGAEYGAPVSGLGIAEEQPVLAFMESFP
jgi:hypothetical protein